MSVAAYPLLLLLQAFDKFNFSKSNFVLFFYFTLSSPKTNSGSLVTKLPHTLLIVNSPVFHRTLIYRSPGPHDQIVFGP